MMIKSSLFDNSMTFAVLLNTVILAMDRYEVPEEEKEIVKTLNDVFTWTFIVEMALKLLAIGPKKYLQDSMNYLDGCVVLLSIIEMSLLSGNEN
mmetsp:Transcript_17433/g.12445  ORF Transcript_17433/g.12445 Transcript_17433/m.12445 type:complete len:94 (-) Transcript_17433:285-566(-)